MLYFASGLFRGVSRQTHHKEISKTRITVETHLRIGHYLHDWTPGHWRSFNRFHDVRSFMGTPIAYDMHGVTGVTLLELMMISEQIPSGGADWASLHLCLYIEDKCYLAQQPQRLE